MERGKIGFVVGLRAEAALLRGRGFMVGIGGGTPEGAAAAAADLIDKGAKSLVSFGLAGGLNPALPAGARVVPRAVVLAASVHACDETLLACLGGATADRLYAGAEIAVTIQQKAALFHQTGADAVDLESGAVARLAEARFLPFAVLRAVADTASCTLPPAAVVALNNAGRISIFPIMASLLEQPRQFVALMRLARDAAASRRTLVERLDLWPVGAISFGRDDPRRSASSRTRL